MDHTEHFPFLVVGGGIGGLLTALSLARNGQRVHVLEQAPEFGEVGAGLQLAPNASRVLDRLGLLERVSRDAFFPRNLVLMDAMSGDQITALETGDAFVQRYGYPYFVTHRGDLLQALLDACRENPLVSLEPDRQVRSVQVDDDGADVACANGSTYRCDALIGADGLWSTLRRELVGDGDPLCSGFVAYRGTVPMKRMEAEAGVRDLHDMVIWTGPGMHLVQYPVRRGELCNQVAVFHSSAYAAGAEEWGTEDELDAAFAGACDRVARGISMIERFRRWPLFDREPAQGWTRGRATLIGDAAHPMLQFLAQGACQAMEDAVALADSVALHPGDVASAFSAYEQQRAPRTGRVQTSARLFGDVMHIGGVGASMRSALLRQRAHDDYGDVDWLYAGGPVPPAASASTSQDSPPTEAHPTFATPGGQS